MAIPIPQKRFVAVLLLNLHFAVCLEIWQQPGCFLVGNTRKISIPDCVEFIIGTNACRGFCTSFAFASLPLRVPGRPHPAKPVTSVGECCNMMATEDIFVNVNCLDGTRRLIFKSATQCACYHCKN